MSKNNPKTILLVEDEPAIAMVGTKVLEKFGYKVICANNGDKAVTIALSRPDIDLILMDIDLSTGMDGTQTAEIILKDRDIPVLFLSSHTETEIVEKTEKITSYGYVVKGSSDTVLDASIKMALKLFEAKLNEKRNQESLREAYQYNEQIIQSANEGIIVYDSDLCYRVWNPYMENISGYTAGEVLGKHPWEVFPFLKETGVTERLKKALKGEPVDSLAFPYSVSKSGKSGWATDTSAPLCNTKGEIIGVIGMVSDITRHKQVEEELKFQSTLLNAVSQAVIATDLAGIIIYFNQAAENLYGWPAEEAIGRNILNVTVPDHSEVQAKEIMAALSAGRSWSGEFIVQNRAGHTFPSLVYNSPILDDTGKLIGIIGISQDITERKQTEDALKESLQKYSLLNETSPDSIVIHSLTEILHVNKSGLELIGATTTDEVMGKSAIDFIHPDDRAAGLDNMKKLFNREVSKVLMEQRFVRLDGRVIDVEVIGVPVEDNKEPKIQLIARDITGRKQAEARIKSLLAEKELLLREVHHRIKNHMNMIIGFLMLQENTLTEPGAIAALQDAQSRVKSMMVLYDKLYRSAGYKELSTNAYLSSLIDEVLNNFPNKDAVQIQKSIEDLVLDSEILFPLGIILNELLTNAMKHAFKAKNDSLIIISFSKQGNSCKLVFQDNGAGIPGHVTIENSTGFGMQLIKMMIHQIHGRIEMERSNGTRFTLEFDTNPANKLNHQP